MIDGDTILAVYTIALTVICLAQVAVMLMIFGSAYCQNGEGEDRDEI